MLGEPAGIRGAGLLWHYARSAINARAPSPATLPYALRALRGGSCGAGNAPGRPYCFARVTICVGLTNCNAMSSQISVVII